MKWGKTPQMPTACPHPHPLNTTKPETIILAVHKTGYFQVSHQIIAAQKLYPFCRTQVASAIRIGFLLQQLVTSVDLYAGVWLSVLLANQVCDLNAVQRFAQIVCTVINRQSAIEMGTG
jgi:hypothetical protein